MTRRLMEAEEQTGIKAAYEERVRQLELAAADRSIELGVLSRVAARIHGEDHPPAILDIALQEVLDGLGLRAGWIFMGDGHDRKLQLAASRGVSGSYLDQIRREGLGECLCPEVFWTGHRMQARNTTQCPRMPTIVEGLGESVAHACVPLMFEGQSRGVLNVATRPGEQFGDEQLQFLETVGHQICTAIERASHLRQERLRNQEALALAAINKSLGGSLDAQAVLDAVGETAPALVHVDGVCIALGSEPANLLVAHQSGVTLPQLSELEEHGRLSDPDGPAAEALRERRPVSIESRRAARDGVGGSGLVLPLLARERTLGVLVLTRIEVRRWSEAQIEMAEGLAAQVSVALENARLYDEARRAYVELRDAQTRIIQNEKMAVVGTFAAGLAHEVRNPLNSIGLQLAILERRLGRARREPPDAPDPAADVLGVVGVIREEVRRLDALVGDFLMLSRTNRVDHAPANLDALVDEVLRLLVPEAADAGIRLQRERRSPLPHLRLDAERLKQVLINLVKNALEALAEVGAEAGEITIESGASAHEVRLCVRDNGPGLPTGLDVFQLFVTTKPKGTGLGLSIAQQIVLEHGGEIRSESRPGKGASFVVSLPVPTKTGETHARH